MSHYETRDPPLQFGIEEKHFNSNHIVLQTNYMIIEFTDLVLTLCSVLKLKYYRYTIHNYMVRIIRIARHNTKKQKVFYKKLTGYDLKDF